MDYRPSRRSRSCEQLVNAGHSPAQVLDHSEFKRLIQLNCIQIGSEWMPVDRDESDPRGAA
jgi:hypothetical protein